MSKEAYVNAWGRTRPSQTQRMFLHIPDLNAAKKGKNIVSIQNIKVIKHIKNSFEMDLNTDQLYRANIQDKESYHGKRAVYYPELSEYLINTTFKIPENSTHVYLSFKVKQEGQILGVLEGVNHPFYVLSRDVTGLKNGWKKVELFSKLPVDNKIEQGMFYAWNKSLLPIYIDDLEIKLLNFTYNDVEY